MKTTVLLVIGLIALALVDRSASADCSTCHAPSSDVPVLAIQQTLHGRLDCSDCHGASLAHGDAPLDAAPDRSFGPRHPASLDAQDSACLDCHAGGGRTHWQASVHQDEEVGCLGCHAIHTREDPTLDRVAQTGTCTTCHSDVRASMRLSSRHPILEGRTACVDCHNPHGSTTEAALVQPTLNDTCYSCHAEKRGPFLFEHPPAAEDCSLCHRAHGSVNDRLLSTRGPFLCQQCHSAAFHPSQLNDGEGLPDGNASPFLLSRNCMNCHAQVHGSNHPSGARLTR
jgi:DmsE family decaheme c-type cytochrome